MTNLNPINTQSYAIDSLIGAWKLLSFDIEIQRTGQRIPGFGPSPKGRLVVLPDTFTALITAASLPLPQTDADRAAAFKQTIAYSGPYEIDGDQIKVKVDISWNAGWDGTMQIRNFKFAGSRLTLISAWQPGPTDPSAVGRGILDWEREA